MGCCASTPSSPSSPYPTTAAPTSSSRAINAPHISQAGLPRPSTTHTSSSRHHEAPGERFNKPLRYPHVWTSDERKTKREIDEEREGFWDTRVDGREEVWATLRVALEILWASDPADNGDAIATAQAMLNAAELNIPSGNLAGGVYDRYGWKYEIPPYVVSYPTNMPNGDNEANEGKAVDTTDEEEEAQRRREEKGKAVLAPEDAITVKVRLSDRGGNDVSVSVGKKNSVRVLARRIMEESGLPATKRLVIMYFGKRMEENKTLTSQGWKDGHVLNAFVLDVVAPPPQ